MNETTGSLWDFYPDSIVVITTNGVVRRDGRAVMGRGCALEAAQRFPGIDVTLAGKLRAAGNVVHDLTAGIVSFPTKHHWREPSDIALIVASARQLVAMADERGWTKIVLPRPGCGHGGLQWEDVKAAIGPILDNRFLVVSR